MPYRSFALQQDRSRSAAPSALVTSPRMVERLRALAHATPWSASVAGGRDRRAHPRPEEREPVDGLVAEHEADVMIGDLAAPATHWSGGNLLLQQAIGDLHTVQPERGDVEQQRPGARRSHHRQAAELAERLVAPPLILGVRGLLVVVGHAESGARSDLGEPAWHQAVVDLDTRDVACERTRRDHPADAPGDHALLERRRAHGDS